MTVRQNLSEDIVIAIGFHLPVPSARRLTEPWRDTTVSILYLMDHRSESTQPGECLRRSRMADRSSATYLRHDLISALSAPHDINHDDPARYDHTILSLHYEMASSKGVDVDSESMNNRRGSLSHIHRADDSLLRKLGYKSEFKREFSVRAQYDYRA